MINSETVKMRIKNSRNSSPGAMTNLVNLGWLRNLLTQKRKKSAISYIPCQILSHLTSSSNNLAVVIFMPHFSQITTRFSPLEEMIAGSWASATLQFPTVIRLSFYRQIFWITRTYLFEYSVEEIIAQ